MKNLKTLIEKVEKVEALTKARTVVIDKMVSSGKMMIGDGRGNTLIVDSIDRLNDIANALRGDLDADIKALAEDVEMLKTLSDLVGVRN